MSTSIFPTSVLPGVAVRLGRALERWGTARQITSPASREGCSRQHDLRQQLESRERAWDPSGQLPRL